MAKQITHDAEAREALMAGATKFARAVKTTLGPRGRYAVLDRGWGAPNITKDGATVADEVELSVPVENLAATMLQQASNKTADEAGDGSTTATVLAEAIFTRGMRSIVAGSNPVALQRGVTLAATRAIEIIESMATPISGNAQIAHVASIAANNNPEIGKVIGDALAKVGEDGIVTIEEGKSLDTTVEYVEGMQFDRGYLSQYFVNREDDAKVVLDNPYILVLEDKVSNLAQILPVLEKVLKKKRPLLIVSEDIDGEALSTLVVNKMRGVMETAAVKAPGYGERRKALLADLAAVTGATVIFKDLGLEPDSIELKHLGTAKRLEITSDTTTIVRGGGAKNAVEERVRLIRLELDSTESDYDREKLQERLARLVGGIAEIQVGGATESEVKEKKKRFENALAATRSAVEEGIVPGGGIALVNCVDQLDPSGIADDDERRGMEIVAAALEMPFRQIAENAGEEASRLLRAIRNQDDWNYGYDFENEKFANLIDAGVIDAFRTLKIALLNAASVAGMLFTTEAVITDIPSPDAGDDHHDHDDMGMGGMGGMGGMPGMGGMGGMGGMPGMGGMGGMPGMGGMGMM